MGESHFPSSTQVRRDQIYFLDTDQFLDYILHIGNSYRH